MSRKPISKKIRFEVFKRDHFTCQYCGRMAPDVILEVDHIKPVAGGGDNEMVNLVTSCRDCNRGKGKRKLTDNDELKKQQAALDDLATRREQAEMMAEWRQSLADTDNALADKASEYIGTVSGYTLNDNGKRSIKKLIKNFSFEEVMEAIEISFDHYYHGTDKTWERAFDKIGGICYNRRHQVTSGHKAITIVLPNDVIKQIEEEMRDAFEVDGTPDLSAYISEMICIRYFIKNQED